MTVIFSLNAGAQTLVPHFDCAEPVYTNGVLTKLKAYYGYENKTGAVINIGDGPNNFFSPNPSGLFSGQQTTRFEPGYHEKSFSIMVNYPQQIHWILNEYAVSTSINPATFCGTGFITYQGRLTNSQDSSNGFYDLSFALYKTETGGAPHPKIISLTGVPVVSGVFTVRLDVSSIFLDTFQIGFLEISVKQSNSSGAYTTLAPRQSLGAVPYALNAKSVSGGSVQIPPFRGVIQPNPSDCDEASEYGQMKFAADSNDLFICGAAGWKSVKLQ